MLTTQGVWCWGQVKFVVKFILWTYNYFNEGLGTTKEMYFSRLSLKYCAYELMIRWLRIVCCIPLNQMRTNAILCFSIYPSAEQENHTGGVPVPITNNTGSLPDLTVLHFPPPLTTPLDAEDQNYGAQPANLSPTSAHHVGMVPQQSASPQAQSPAQRRRPHQGGPSPLVLSSSPSQQMRMPHSPPVSVSLWP